MLSTPKHLSDEPFVTIAAGHAKESKSVWQTKI